MTLVFETRGLSKTFGAVTAAADINVTINEGEMVGVIGSNGAGKTTFINMVTGYLKPSAGSILFKEREMVGLEPRDVTRAGICRSFQIAQLFPELSVLDNVLIAYGISVERRLSFFRPLKNAESINKARRILEEYSIDGYIDAPVATLPQGVRKLLDIAMAMLGGPSLLLLDEPTSGVAIDDKFELMETIMKAVRASGAATLFVEHDMEVVERYAPRVIAFYDGRVLSDGPTEHVLSDPQVQEFVIGTHKKTGRKQSDA
jgi:branched-chain amino acid transport system ATP-binding protein